MVDRLDLLGAVVALVVFVSSIVVFSARMMFDLPPGHWIGVPFLLTALPLGYLLYRAGGEDRPLLYPLQVGLMLASVIVVFLLDYALGVDWRHTRWMVVAFVTLYFAGLGGMIGVASRAGTSWMVASIVLFFATGAMAFIQRAVTGL